MNVSSRTANGVPPTLTPEAKNIHNLFSPAAKRTQYIFSPAAKKGAALKNRCAANRTLPPADGARIEILTEKVRQRTAAPPKYTPDGVQYSSISKGAARGHT